MKLYPSLKENEKDGRGMTVMFLREVAGEIETQDGNKYECSANMHGFHPIVTSLQTGRKISLSWEDIVLLAIDAGIDSKDPIPQEGVCYDLSVRRTERPEADLPITGDGKGAVRSDERVR